RVYTGGGGGSYAGEADIGGEQGDWIWVSRRRRKATGSDWTRQDRIHQENGFRGRVSARHVGRIDHGYDREFHRRDGVCYRDARLRSGMRYQSRARRSHSPVRGRSLPRRHHRPPSIGTEQQGTQLMQLKGCGINDKQDSNNGSVGLKASQVFYFSNFPDKLSYVDLRKGLEVCGILDDMYVSRYRNNQGFRFGFAKFLKVRDVEKLRKALNTVQFWDLRLFANVAKYDRFVRKVSNEGVGGGRVGEGVNHNREHKMRRVACDVVVVGSLRKLELEKVKEDAIKSEEVRERERERVRVTEASEGSGRKGEVVVESLERKEEGRS
ncbi:hypothetical protein TSUD_422760, partial [Trifolium subterraneum]